MFRKRSETHSDRDLATSRPLIQPWEKNGRGEFCKISACGLVEIPTEEIRIKHRPLFRKPLPSFWLAFRVDFLSSKALFFYFPEKSGGSAFPIKNLVFGKVSLFGKKLPGWKASFPKARDFSLPTGSLSSLARPDRRRLK